ncbi:LOW QUALITY PROTEIN: WD repeat-containing protein 17-like [Babylonia areolata]|uniref:LOW QUALITY PROTEIN: WD repeat-containing protein 17-like n=1 Tax=Babylonia areolata TaxID=304850 RepID=UPI003FD54C12
MVKQVALLPAGCQPWNRGVCAASKDHFAYCATLAIYIYKLDRRFKEFRLLSIMSEHKKTITSISWHPSNPDLIASSGADLQIIVWSISQQRSLAVLQSGIKEVPTCIRWSHHDNTCLAFISGRGPLYLWQHTEKQAPSIVKDSQNFSTNITMFRWHPKKQGMIVFGHYDGSISILNIGSKGVKHILAPEVEDDDDVDPVTALAWDPLSVEYLLVANRHSGVRLVDVTARTVITTFIPPSTAAQVQTLSWVHNAPGMFVTGDVKSGVLRIWSVSKVSPIENIRMKKSGFHDVHIIPESPVDETVSHSSHTKNSSHVSSTSEAQSPSLTAHTRFALPHAQMVCTFKDGGIGLYDLGHRRWRFLRDQGHLETIFDCKFCPSNPNHLATASFDGTIKVWDIMTMQTVMTSAGNEGIIYHISWAPGDLGCIACCTSKNGIFIWNLNKSKVIKRIQDHGEGAVFSLSWNQKNSRLILSCGASGYCMIHQVDGTLVQKYKHPAPVFGGDWSPYDKDMFATGCEDKQLRVFRMDRSNTQPLMTFSGHTAKVFHIRWSPLMEGVLCSGSDDCTVRVWNVTQDQCMCKLSGHSAPVRGLTWNSEVPYLLVSGSWDSSIRVWDIRDGACLFVVVDHGADVYGLTCHPSRPFLMASCSRDSTLRLWSLTPLVQPLELSLLARKPLSEFLGTPERSMCLGTPPMLTGAVSGQVRDSLARLTEVSHHSHLLTSFSRILSPPIGTENLWDLVSVAVGGDVMTLSLGYKKGIVHASHFIRFKASEAQELEMVKMSRFGSAIGMPSKEEQLREAAQIHIRLGNLQRYCELMVELGEWERGLATAPGVSLQYWKSLAERYTKFLRQEENEDVIPFAAATGNVQELVRYFHSNGQYQEAMVSSQAACEDAFFHPHLVKDSKSHHSSESSEADQNSHRELLKESCLQLSERHFSNGSPVLAACCHLAIDDFQGAMSKLIRGNELELAISMGTVLGNVPQHLRLATHLLSRRCEHLGKWELGVDLLKTIPDSEDLLIRLCARCAASMDEINHLHRQAGLPSMEECIQKAQQQERHADPASVLSSVGFYLLSTEPERGLRLGLQFIKEKLSTKDWTADDLTDMLHLLGCIRTDRLQHHKNTILMYELLALSSYVGTLVAIRRGYHELVPALFRHTREMMTKEMIQLPLSLRDVEQDYEAWAHHQKDESRGGEGEPSSPGWVQLQRRLGCETWPLEFGPDCVASSHLPSHSDVHVSVLTGHRIRGLAVFLEDGNSALSVNEALMWAKVNPFSPLGSGMRITPF